MVSKTIAEHCSSWSVKILGFLEFEWKWFIKKEKELLVIVKLFDVKIGNKSGKKAHGMATETSYLRINLYLGFYTAVAVWELLLYMHLPKVVY